MLGQLQNKVPCPQGAAGLQVKPTSRLAFKVLAGGLANLSHQPSSRPCYVPPHCFAHMPGIQKPPYLCSGMPFLPLPSSEPIPPSCLEQIPCPLTCPWAPVHTMAHLQLSGPWARVTPNGGRQRGAKEVGNHGFEGQRGLQSICLCHLLSDFLGKSLNLSEPQLSDGTLVTKLLGHTGLFYEHIFVKVQQRT